MKHKILSVLGVLMAVLKRARRVKAKNLFKKLLLLY